MKKNILIKVLFVVILLFVYNCNAASSNNYEELNSPTSNGAFFNNLNFTDYKVADPFILKEKDTYYVYGTGLKIYKSTDFKTWKKVTGKAIAREGDYTSYWAPEVYKYNNKFYMFYTGVRGGKGRDILVAVSDSPEGPFSKKAKINSKVKWPIDPNVLFDGDKIYLYTKGDIGSSGVCCNGDGTSIYVEELNDDLLSVKKGSKPIKLLSIGESSPTWENYLVEGSYIFKEKGKYYLMYSTHNRKFDADYTVGYAVSSSPTGPFKRAANSIPLLTGRDSYDTDKNLYHTGHNSVIKISDDERYIVYHSYIYKNHQYVSRKLTIDYMGVDSKGRLYVNGPSISNQPLPSGSKGLYKVNISDYKVKSNSKEVSYLHDNVNYNVLKTANSFNSNTYVYYKKAKTKSIIIEPNTDYKIEDIWLFGTSSGFNNTKADIIINDKYIIKKVNLKKNTTSKIQIPIISEKINAIKINFSSKVELSEVSLYGKKSIGSNNTITGDVNGDGKVSSQDYILVKNHITGKLLTGDLLKSADFNGDGKINSQDYILIKKYIMNSA